MENIPTTLFVGVVVLSGLGVGIWWLHRWMHGKVAAPPAQLPAWNLLAAVICSLLVLSSLQARYAAPTRSTVDVAHIQQTMTTQAALFVLLLLMLKYSGGYQVPRPWSGHGISVSQPGRQIAWGALGFLGCIPWVLLLLWISQALRSPENQHAYIQALRDHTDGTLIWWIGISVVVVAPLVEELQYRVVLQSAMRQEFPPLLAVLLSSVLFCAVHGWPDALPLLPLACMLGGLYEWTRSYLAVVVTHAAFNAFNLTLVLNQTL